MTVVSSRGCPAKCEFCSRAVFGSRRTCHSASYVVEMVKRLRDIHNVRQIQFDDDDFMVQRTRLLDICGGLRRETPNVRWCCYARVDRIDADMLKEMKAAGCWQIKFGIESGSQEMLERMNKRISLEQIRAAVAEVRRAGMVATGHFMIGYPGETVESARRTMDLAVELRLDEFFMTYLTPFPGTAIWRRATELGSYDPDWRRHSGWRPVFVPNTLTQQQLVDLRNEAYRKFYFRFSTVWGFLRRIGSLRQFFLTVKGFVFFLGLLSADRRARPQSGSGDP